MSGAVSGAFARFRGLTSPFSKHLSGGLLNASGRAGPRRLAVLIAGLLAVIALVFIIAASGRQAQVLSRDARMQRVDPLPGGLHSTPEQDAIALQANDAQARAALQKGVSFTPQIAPSQLVSPPPPRVEQAAPARPAAVARPPAAAQRPVQAVFPAPLPAEAGLPGVQPRPVPVAATTVDPRVEQAYMRQIDDLFSQWGGRAPHPDVVVPPAQEEQAERPAQTRGSGAGAAASPVAAATQAAETGMLLIPAGRGVFAHPILAVNSDASSPVVLQADSGPIAGDRMIGTFAKQQERLVIHVSTIIHNGETIGVDGVVVAPDTMEAGVASNVDQHYLTRFLLPVAAAFVQGLGQAIATTSNTAAVLSPFGGATTTTHLNIDQQLGMAAGVAASQIGATLNQAAPRGPTVSLDANVAVGVMFLANVTAHRGS